MSSHQVSRAAGGLVAGTGAAPLDREKFQPGGAVRVGETWFPIYKVNKKTVDTYQPFNHFRKFHTLSREDIAEVMTPAQVAALGDASLTIPAEILNPPKVKRTAPQVNGVTREKFGEIGWRSGLRFSGPADHWRLITKVNQKTCETLRKDPTSATPRYMTANAEIYDACEALTPAQVIAQKPELLQWWTDVQRIRQAKAARLAVASQPQPMFETPAAHLSHFARSRARPRR